MTGSDFRKIILVAVCGTDGRGELEQGALFCEDCDNPGEGWGLEEGRCVGMGTRWIREMEGRQSVWRLIAAEGREAGVESYPELLV